MTCNFQIVWNINWVHMHIFASEWTDNSTIQTHFIKLWMVCIFRVQSVYQTFHLSMPIQKRMARASPPSSTRHVRRFSSTPFTLRFMLFPFLYLYPWCVLDITTLSFIHMLTHRFPSDCHIPSSQSAVIATTSPLGCKWHKHWLAVSHQKRRLCEISTTWYSIHTHSSKVWSE